jgi:hypothetical protein
LDHLSLTTTAEGEGRLGLTPAVDPAGRRSPFSSCRNLGLLRSIKYVLPAGLEQLNKARQKGDLTFMESRWLFGELRPSYSQHGFYSQLKKTVREV